MLKRCRRVEKKCKMEGISIAIQTVRDVNWNDCEMQGGITCGAIEDPRKSSKAIDERVIINFRDKNGVIARFRDKNVVIVRFCDKNVECLYIYYGVIEE